MNNVAKGLVRGSVLVTASGLVLRAVSLVTQVFLGWMLTKEEFGLYGIAVSMTAIVACFQDSGVGKLLISRNAEFERFKNAGAALSIACNCMIAVSLVGIGWIYSVRQTNSTIFGLLVVLALSHLVGSSLIVSRADLSRRLAFRSLAKIDTIANSMSQLLKIPLAFAGAGAYSFVLPEIIRKFYLHFALRKASPHHVSYWQPTFWRSIRREDLKILTASMPWIMFSSLAIGLIQSGDYFVLGWMVTKELVGVYFFGFQLTVALSSMITSPLAQVFMPSLANLNHEPDQQISVYLRSIRAISFVAYPICFCGILLAPSAIHLVWNGKWDDAILVSQLLLLALPLRLVAPLGRALLEARGRWRISAALLGIDAAGTVASAGIGASFGSLFAIAACMTAWRFLIGAIHSLTALLALQGEQVFNREKLKETIKSLIQYPVVTLSVMALVFLISSFDFSSTSVGANIMLASALLIGYTAVSLILFREEIREIVRLKSYFVPSKRTV